MTNFSAESRASVLRQVELFADLSDSEIERLSHHFQDQTIDDRRHIFQYGDPSTSFYVIRSGTVAVFRNEVGKPVQLQARLGPGDFFGETGLFDGFKRSASARSGEPCRLLVIDKDELLDFLETHPDVLMKLQIAAARRHTLNVAAALDLGMRQEVRIRIDRAVNIETSFGQMLTMRLENLSLGGLCLRGAPPSWTKGRQLSFTVNFEEESLDVSGKVSWREPDTLGLAFAHTDSTSDTRVQAMLRRLLAH